MPSKKAASKQDLPVPPGCGSVVVLTPAKGASPPVQKKKKVVVKNKDCPEGKCAKKPVEKVCPDGKVLNPKTNRCVKARA